MSNLEETKNFLEIKCIENCGHNSNENCICTLALCFKEIEKAQEQEKVLKIIKEKYVHIPQLLCAFENQLEVKNPLEFYYNGQVGINVPMPLTEEEFELLKQYFEKNIQKQ